APGAETSPWFTAMTQTLRERAIDAVHFICRCSVVAGRASLRLADPVQSGAPLAAARFPSTGEVATVLTRLGAWAAIFTLPRGAPESELRWFADGLAQARPGAVLYDGGGDLAALYRFLFAPQPSDPPRLGGSFLYCQPAIVADPALSRIIALGQNAHL